ncbi:MAG TPA: hypothetical protein VHC94_17935 [Nitrobacter sp.]|jgi:hypothetical protein|nr:hypothetical protein [Nitrobacter sp.]
MRVALFEFGIPRLNLRARCASMAMIIAFSASTSSGSSNSGDPMSDQSILGNLLPAPFAARVTVPQRYLSDRFRTHDMMQLDPMMADPRPDNRAFSSHFKYKHAPLPSHHTILI